MRRQNIISNLYKEHVSVMELSSVDAAAASTKH